VETPAPVRTVIEAASANQRAASATEVVLI
jgi:hypothetical protein